LTGGYPRYRAGGYGDTGVKPVDGLLVSDQSRLRRRTERTDDIAYGAGIGLHHSAIDFLEARVDSLGNGLGVGKGLAYGLVECGVDLTDYVLIALQYRPGIGESLLRILQRDGGYGRKLLVRRHGLSGKNLDFSCWQCCI
jgi:hypothetical protein